MIMGAGFRYGSVPLTRELLDERIGDFFLASLLQLQQSGQLYRSSVCQTIFTLTSILCCNGPFRL
jgi:hypothetical protein